MCELPEGTVGRVKTDHESDGDYSAAARVVRATARTVTVELLEDFYCLEAGDRFRTRRDLFTLNAQAQE